MRLLKILLVLSLCLNCYEKPTPKLLVCTTTMITDLVKNLASPEWPVVGIMKVGQDPHTYEPRPSDALLIQRAKVVFQNGLKLEGTLQDIILNNLPQTSLLVSLAETEGIQVRTSTKYKGAPDPHVWMNVDYFRKMAKKCLAVLEQIDPKNREKYRQRYKAYAQKLKELHQWVKKKIQSIPKERRVLITTHDAFFYYGSAYGLKVHSIIGISTDQQPKPQDVEKLKKLISKYKVPTVFVETSVNTGLKRLMEKIQRQTGVRLAPPLYSDSLGDQNSPAKDYLSMIRYDTQVIWEGLTYGMGH